MTTAATLELPSLPAIATRLRSLPIELEAAAPKASAEGSSALPAARLKLTCRTDAPVYVPAKLKNGDTESVPMYHDLDGFQSPGKTACDYAHNDSDLIGGCENYRRELSAIVCDAAIEALEAADTADKIIKRMSSKRAKVPYQSSVFWEGESEAVPHGQKFNVNGKDLEGPAFVVRKWTIRQMAICPAGADAFTSATLISKLSAETLVEAEIEVLEGEEKPAEETKPEEKPNEATAQEQGEGAPAASAPTEATPPVAGEEAKTLSLADLRRFNAKFGADALSYIEQGLDYAAALEKHLEKTAGELSVSRGKVAELETKLAKPANVPNRGEANPLSASHASGKQTASRFAHLGALAPFAEKHDPNASRN